MLKYAMKLFKEEDGQAMTEYGLLVGLIAIVVVAAIILVGEELLRVFNLVVTELKKAV